MRAAGVDEKFITGASTDEEKFSYWAKTVPQTIGNPLFHWTHLELKNPFGIQEYLDEKSAPGIYTQCNALLQTDDFTVTSLLRKFNVSAVVTTDDPCSDLHFHQLLKNNYPGFSVSPTFRPDAYIQISEINSFINNISRLEEIADIEIKDLNSFIEALHKRMDFFHDNGCRISDHGLRYIPDTIHYSRELDASFKLDCKAMPMPSLIRPFHRLCFKRTV